MPERFCDRACWSPRPRRCCRVFSCSTGGALMAMLVSQRCVAWCGAGVDQLGFAPLIVGAFAAGLSCRNVDRIPEAITAGSNRIPCGVVFPSGMFGIGIIMYSLVTTNQHLDHRAVLAICWARRRAGPLDGWLISVFVTAFLVLSGKRPAAACIDPAPGSSKRAAHWGFLHMGCWQFLSLTTWRADGAGLILGGGAVGSTGAIAFFWWCASFGR